jgi:hypothetical protein
MSTENINRKGDTHKAYVHVTGISHRLTLTSDAWARNYEKQVTNEWGYTAHSLASQFFAKYVTSVNARFVVDRNVCTHQLLCMHQNT